MAPVAASAEWLDGVTLASARERFGRAESRFISMSGVDLHVLDSPGSGTGPDVVLLSAQWLGVSQGDRWAPLLTAARRIVRVDLPGQGLSGAFPDGDYSARAYAELVAVTVSELGLGDHVLVGTSFSGIAAALYAASRPPGLAGLVLATSSGLPRASGGPAPNAPPADPRAAEMRGTARPRAFYHWKMAELLRRPHREHEMTRLVDEVHVMNEIPGRVEEARRRAAQHDPAIFAPALGAAGVPVLVQWSSHSTYLAPVLAERIAAIVPHLHALHHYPKTGHLLIADAPEDCARDLQAMLVQL